MPNGTTLLKSMVVIGILTFFFSGPKLFLEKVTTRNQYCLQEGIDVSKALPTIDSAELDNRIKAHQGRLEWFKNKDSEHSFAVGEDPPTDAVRLSLRGLDLRDRDFSQKDLRGADFTCSDLRRANFKGANLSRAYLTIADPVKENPTRHSQLATFDFSGSDLRGASLEEADLTGAFVQHSYIGITGMPVSLTELRDQPLWTIRDDGCDEADEGWTSPRGTRSTKLRGAVLNDADLAFSTFNPDLESLPSALNFTAVKGIHVLRYCRAPTALTALREDLKKIGAKDQARWITLAIRRQDANTDLIPALSFWLFDFTSAWGSDPSRPLTLLLISIPLFAIAYRVALRPASSARIWLVYPDDRLERAGEIIAPERVTFCRLDRKKVSSPPGIQPWRASLFLSVSSVFAIGWHDLNIGTWIQRISGREWFFRASGWARSSTGIQSVIGVYLLALWVLAYFGYPFDY